MSSRIAAKPTAPAPSTKVLSFIKKCEIASSIFFSFTRIHLSTFLFNIFEFIVPIFLTAMPSATLPELKSISFYKMNYKKKENFLIVLLLFLYFFLLFATIEQPDRSPPPPTGINSVSICGASSNISIIRVP